MPRIFIAVILLLAAIPTRAQSDGVIFTPRNGFSGMSEGDGVLRILFRHKSFHVESHGFDRPDGLFQLDQVEYFAGDAPETRSWVIRPAGERRYVGTLTGASDVSGETSGAKLTLRYRIKGPLFMHQVLTLATDGRSIFNVGHITLFGIPIGSLRETIRRKD